MHLFKCLAIMTIILANDTHTHNNAVLYVFWFRVQREFNLNTLKWLLDSKQINYTKFVCY